MGTETTTKKCLGCGRVETNETPNNERVIGLLLSFSMYDGTIAIASHSHEDNNAWYCSVQPYRYSCRYKAFQVLQAKIIERMKEQEEAFRKDFEEACTQ